MGKWDNCNSIINKYIKKKRKEQIKTPEKELSNEEIDNLSDSEFKTLVIRVLTEMIEYRRKIVQEVKAMQSEIKKNTQGTVKGRIQVNDLEQKEEINNETKNLFEKIMKESFPNLAKEIDLQKVQEAQRVPKKLDSKRSTPRHIIIELCKIKENERNLKAARGKERVTYKGVHIRLSADFSKETLQARRGW